MTRRQIRKPAAFIPPPNLKTTGRDRSWEKRQTTVTYRNIPEDIKAQIKELAAAHHVTVNEIARLILEYGLAQLNAGAFELGQPTLINGKLTFFPPDST